MSLTDNLSFHGVTIFDISLYLNLFKIVTLVRIEVYILLIENRYNFSVTLFFMTDGLATLVREDPKTVPVKFLTAGTYVTATHKGSDSEAPYGTCGACCKPLEARHFKTTYNGEYCDDRCAWIFTED